jgi:hypothetical protein
VLAAATCREADELRAQVARLRKADEAEIHGWVGAGAHGARPAPSTELLAAERRLGEIAGAAGVAEAEISIAQEGYAGAAERARHAMQERDRALWPAMIEAAGAATVRGPAAPHHASDDARCGRGFRREDRRMATRPAHPLDKAPPQLRTYRLWDLVDQLTLRNYLSLKTVSKSSGRSQRDNRSKRDHSTLEAISADQITDPQMLGGIGKSASAGQRRKPIAAAKLRGRQSSVQVGRSGRRDTKHGRAQAEENNDPSLLFDAAWYVSRYPDV